MGDRANVKAQIEGARTSGHAEEPRSEGANRECETLGSGEIDRKGEN